MGIAVHVVTVLRCETGLSDFPADGLSYRIIDQSGYNKYYTTVTTSWAVGRSYDQIIAVAGAQSWRPTVFAFCSVLPQTLYILLLWLFIIVVQSDAVSWISYVLQLFRARCARRPRSSEIILLLLLWWDCLRRITTTTAADDRPGELTREEKQNRKKKMNKNTTLQY